jgi:hypothetical protein
MKQINCTVIGRATDTPVLHVDNGLSVLGVFESASRVIFTIADDVPPWGATIHYGRHEVRVMVPPFGALEGPVLTYGDARVTIVNGSFYCGGVPWCWKGATEMRLPHRLSQGEDARPILEQRRDCGANLVRSLAMVDWSPDVVWGPKIPEYWDYVRRYLDLVGDLGLFCEWVAFATTATLMPNADMQQAFWDETQTVVRDYPFVLLELLNEYGHPTQQLDPTLFRKPEGILASHGSGLTDADTVQPYWDYATYHGRRKEHPTDGRAATAYSPYAYQEDFPKPVPFVNEESEKPEGYGYDVRFARLMGQHAACGWGGTFHSNEGVQSLIWPTEVEACARAFYEGLS